MVKLHRSGQFRLNNNTSKTFNSQSTMKKVLWKNLYRECPSMLLTHCCCCCCWVNNASLGGCNATQPTLSNIEEIIHFVSQRDNHWTLQDADMITHDIIRWCELMTSRVSLSWWQCYFVLVSAAAARLTTVARSSSLDSRRWPTDILRQIHKQAHRQTDRHI